MQQTVLAQYCEDKILDIPKSLFNLRDVKPLLFNGESGVFYKDLERDLVNVEFHTTLPCIVYIKSGSETITNHCNEIYSLGPGEALFLPQGLNLHSDYLHEKNGLNAYLLFFGEDVLSRFMSAGNIDSRSRTNKQAIYKIGANTTLDKYFKSFHSIYDCFNNSSQLLQLKLLELLFIVDLIDGGNLRSRLLAEQKGRKKRNIKRLMDRYALSRLSVQQLALLSGRSVSAFNREFKLLYNTTPKQWLIDRRLDNAHSLLSKEGWTVTAVAIEAGYSNVSHFIAAFKKKYGATPHQIKSED